MTEFLQNSGHLLSIFETDGYSIFLKALYAASYYFLSALTDEQLFQILFPRN